MIGRLYVSRSHYRQTVNERGFTVLELLVSITIAAVLLSVATPNFTETIQNNRMVTQLNEAHAAISRARSEAIRRNTNVTICSSSNGTSCHRHDNHWHHGWMAFVDSDADGNPDGEEVLLFRGKLEAKNRLVSSVDAPIIFSSSGLARSGAGTTLELCDKRGPSDARALIISPSGRPRLATDSDENGTLEDIEQDDLECTG